MSHKKREKSFLDQAIKDLESMTHEQKVEVAIKAGIISEDGKLTELYGGTGQASPSSKYTRRTDLSESELEMIHRKSLRNYQALDKMCYRASKHKVTCLHCKLVYSPAELDFESTEDWCDDHSTAICPHCCIDAVYPGELSEEVLSQVHNHYFGVKK